MAEAHEVADEGNLITLADMSINNVFDQLELDKLTDEQKEEISQIMRNEIRRVEVELSVMLMDMRKVFAEDIESLKASGKLPEGHILQVMGEVANAAG